MASHATRTAASVALVAGLLGCTASIGASGTLGPPGSCTTNASLQCISGAYGWSCPAGYNPEDQVAGLSCSIPVADGPNDDFCCFQWTYGTTCTPDDTITAVCTPGTYGFVCQAGDDPHSLDPTLTCSVPTPVGPHDEFCCY
jgi:hypothetical protein